NVCWNPNLRACRILGGDTSWPQGGAVRTAFLPEPLSPQFRFRRLAARSVPGGGGDGCRCVPVPGGAAAQGRRRQGRGVGGRAGGRRRRRGAAGRDAGGAAVGLTEMFPESVRSAAGATFDLSLAIAQKMYRFSRAALWIGTTSFMILVLPVVFETEKLQMEQQQQLQQRQILLGPNTGLSGGMPGALPPLPGKI
uniref:Mitochondrial import receptor subunit TOM22 homolog n=1 Tax=Meleagris gallopavo TaxID=9103 RepID=G1NIK6_MELGA